ncbi:FecR family protein [Labilibacter marinus]|uniref:FecR family protein n=1 Tax=Labilibacter marinus TaxID=1477105 RepID=UPI00082CF715|nr:FecR domain-containing protein [Labilibacter marinus]
MTTNNIEHIDWDLISGALEGSLSNNEKVEFDSWVTDNNNRQHYDEIKRVWEQTGSISYCFNEDTNRAWSETSQKLFDAKNNRIKKITIRIAQAAAILALVFIASKLLFNHEKQQLITQNEILKDYKLPDNSSVSINRHSKLSYINDFKGSSRNIWLEGEAFFDVAKNPNKPFIVKTHKGQFRVLGTSFNISCYQKNDEVALTVKTGKVMFVSPNNNQVIAIKGETIKYNPQTNKLIKTKITNPNATSWQTRKLIFNNTRLFDVLRTLENVYDVHITIKNKHINEFRLSANFDDQPLDKILKVLALTFDLESRELNKEIELYLKK